MTDDDKAALSTEPASTLALWWVQIQRGGGWPDVGLGAPDPSPFATGLSRRARIANAIVRRIGIKACLREWYRPAFNDQQFDIWWASHGSRYLTTP